MKIKQPPSAFHPSPSLHSKLHTEHLNQPRFFPRSFPPWEEPHTRARPIPSTYIHVLATRKPRPYHPGHSDAHRSWFCAVQKRQQASQRHVYGSFDFWQKNHDSRSWFRWCVFFPRRRDWGVDFYFCADWVGHFLSCMAPCRREAHMYRIPFPLGKGLRC